MKKNNLFDNLKSDFASGLVVFLVALPLCLGIALASGAPLFSGIISGIIGGIIVGYLSKSQLSVSGPAAGLTAIVLTAITDLGAFDIFLTAIFIAGFIQLGLGFLKAGGISNYFPTNVIEGMLAGIGIIIILKQIPHAFGLDDDFVGDLSYPEADGGNTFATLLRVVDDFELGSALITGISLLILIYWDKVPFLKNIKLVPSALIAVIFGVVLNEILISSGSFLAITDHHLVSLPMPTNFEEFKSIIVTPKFSEFLNPDVWLVAVTIAIVASIETLLSIEASDRLDAQKRYTDTNVELKAQGIGNIVSSLIGGLPLTSVIVRSSANNNAGAKSKMSTIIHGVLLLVSVMTIPIILNKIPLATLAAILLLIGYKLAKPATFIHFWSKGKYQFIPFIATLLAVVFTDLLKGVALGVIISIIFILRGNIKQAFIYRKETTKEGDVIHIDLAQEVSFLNKAAIKLILNQINENSNVIINASNTVYIAHDILDLIYDFQTTRALDQNINVKLKGFKEEYELENSDEPHNNVTFDHYYDVAKRILVKNNSIKNDIEKK